MLLISRIVIFFTALLISAVNSGLVSSFPLQRGLPSQNEMIPSGQRFQLPDYLITDILPGSENRINTQKADRISHEIKSWNFIRVNEIKDTYHEGNHKTLFQQSIFSYRVFSTPDIIYPFSFFG